nr:hypothetical protein BaRGS_024404 [Batillaria attramentaria]
MVTVVEKKEKKKEEKKKSTVFQRLQWCSFQILGTTAHREAGVSYKGNNLKAAPVKLRRAGGAVRSLHAGSVGTEKPFVQRAMAPRARNVTRCDSAGLPVYDIDDADDEDDGYDDDDDDDEEEDDDDDDDGDDNDDDDDILPPT